MHKCFYGEHLSTLVCVRCSQTCEVNYFISKLFTEVVCQNQIHLEKMISLNCSHGKDVFISVFT